MNGGYVTGAIVLAVAAWSLATGKVTGRGGDSWTRAQNPVGYWFVIAVYLAVALAGFVSGRRDGEIRRDVERDQATGEVAVQGSNRELPSGPAGVEAPPEIELLRDSALDLHRDGRFVEAIAIYDQAIAGASNDPQLYYWRGMARQKVGQNDLALTDYQRVIGLDYTSYDAHVAADRLMSAQRRFGDVVAMWTRYIDRVPGKADAHYERAGAFFHSGNRDAARIDAQRACDLGHARGCTQANGLRR